MSTPKDLRYSKEHEWVKEESGNSALVLHTLHNLNWEISFSLNFHKLAMI